MYIIIIGAGKIGSELIDLASGDHDIVVVEKLEERAQTISSQYDCMVINADGTSRETLEDAGIHEADAVITTTDQDAVNLMVCMLAKEFDVESIVSVVHEGKNETMFNELGVNVIANPPQIIARDLYRAVQRPQIKDFMDLMGSAEVFEITATPDSRIVGVPLEKAKNQGILPRDTIVVAIERDQDVITPTGDTTIEGGDLITVFSKQGSSDPITSIFTG